MVLAQSVYQNPIEKNSECTEPKNVIYYPSITTWILSNCASCQDVIDGLKYDKLVVHNKGSKITESKIKSFVQLDLKQNL